ncbi:hypothetical protein SBV1_820026 [Verrucomicrobia bacterium]|nr:hypothetical protein SBV1_820026 [Verrucomicrobiota bacterium]
MVEHHTETAFLRHIILYDDSDERCKLEQSIVQVRRDARCVRRVALVTAIFPLLAMTGVGYGVFLGKDFPYNLSEPVLEVLCVVALASLICLMGFAGVLTVYFWKLHRLRKEARRLVMRLLESRLGKPQIAKLSRSHRASEDRGASQGATEFGV